MCGVRPKFWEAVGLRWKKASERSWQLPGVCPDLFLFYWSLGVFTSVLSMYLTGIGKSKAEMSFIMSASSLFAWC